MSLWRVLVLGERLPMQLLSAETPRTEMLLYLADKVKSVSSFQAPPLVYNTAY